MVAPQVAPMPVTSLALCQRPHMTSKISRDWVGFGAEATSPFHAAPTKDVHRNWLRADRAWLSQWSAVPRQMNRSRFQVVRLDAIANLEIAKRKA